MQEQNRNNQNDKKETPDYLTGKGHGPEGVDKAPGEETSQDSENVVFETQKGQGKEDGDPDQPSDQPIDLNNKKG